MKDIIERLQDGDELAFKELTQSIENDLYRIARTRLKDDDDIKDAIQNTMIATYKSVKKIRNAEAFKTWMIKVLINECNRIYNFNKRNNAIFDKIVQDVYFNSYENSIQNINEKMNFDSMLEKLNYEERIVITLHYNSGYSCSQIAKILKTSVNTIKSRLTRGNNKLKVMYEEVNNYGIK